MLGCLRSIMVGLLLVLLVQCVGFADVPTDPVKFSQLPKETWSFDLSSEIKLDTTGAPLYDSLVADDWQCPDGKYITDIHWWGSYWAVPQGARYIDYSDSRGNAPKGGITGFKIKIWSDVPADDANNTFGFSHPGTVLKEIPISGTANETWVYDVTKGTLKESVYQYYVDLPKDLWFDQTKGTIYWLSIQAILPDPTRQWGWHEHGSTEDAAHPHWDWCVMDKSDGGWWYNPCGYHDMAFELTSVPEPTSLFSLGMGMISLCGMALRARRPA